MGHAARKTEHSGAKHGVGAFWGPKRVAKKTSNRVRRENGKREVRSGMDDSPTLDGRKP
jgi:hypothetical protein